MADKKIIHHHDSDGGSSGMGAILGVLVGAVLVVGIHVFATNWDRGGGGSKVSINIPAAPSAPSMPRPAPAMPLP